LVRGPAGVLVVPGLWAPGGAAQYSEKGQHRLLKQIQLLGRHTDLVILDVGSGSNDVVRRFWQAANDVLLVTTPDAVAVMDAYATIKTLLGTEKKLSLQLIVNQCTDSVQATDVHRRIDQSCRRFLGLAVGMLGHVPQDPQIGVMSALPSTTGPSGRGHSAACQAIGRLAAMLVEESGAPGKPIAFKAA
jgi:flagellar biosynthesis protein FlhG